MSRKIPPKVFVFSLFFAALGVVTLSAAIKPVTLPEMLDMSSGVMSGQIIAKEVVLIYDPVDEMNEVWTRLTISGQEMTTGETVTQDLYYMGGVWNGFNTTPVTAPRDYQTRVGANVVAFYWFDPSLTSNGANKIFCYANVFQVHRGSGDPTVIGLGDGTAVAFNTKLSSLSTEIVRQWKDRTEREGRK